MTKSIKRIRGERPILPPLEPIKGLGAAMERAIKEADAELFAQMEADRIEMRRARANDPTRCHCPVCYVIG